MIHHFQDLKGKKVLVTGALRGIGRATAKALAANQASVVINFRSRPQAPEQAQQLCQELKSLGASEAHALAFDVCDYNKTKESLEHFVKDQGPFSGVVNNAGISRDALLLRLKENDIHALIDTNLKGALSVTQVLARSLLKAQDVSIVNISSIVGLSGNPGQSVYAASKAGLLGLTKSVAKELGGRKIRCNAICPGFIETEMTQALDSDKKRDYLSHIPLKRLGEVDEIANLILFLLSGASSYITGEVIRIDGGMGC